MSLKTLPCLPPLILLLTLSSSTSARSEDTPRPPVLLARGATVVAPPAAAPLRPGAGLPVNGQPGQQAPREDVPHSKGVPLPSTPQPGLYAGEGPQPVKAMGQAPLTHVLGFELPTYPGMDAPEQAKDTMRWKRWCAGLLNAAIQEARGDLRMAAFLSEANEVQRRCAAAQWSRAQCMRADVVKAKENGLPSFDMVRMSKDMASNLCDAMRTKDWNERRGVDAAFNRALKALGAQTIDDGG